MSADMNPSLVSWLTTMMSMRLQVLLEHMPVTEEQILQYVRRVGDPPQVMPGARVAKRGLEWGGGGWLRVERGSSVPQAMQCGCVLWHLLVGGGVL